MKAACHIGILLARAPSMGGIGWPNGPTGRLQRPVGPLSKSGRLPLAKTNFRGVVNLVMPAASAPGWSAGTPTSLGHAKLCQVDLSGVPATII